MKMLLLLNGGASWRCFTGILKADETPKEV